MRWRTGRFDGPCPVSRSSTATCRAAVRVIGVDEARGSREGVPRTAAGALAIADFHDGTLPCRGGGTVPSSRNATVVVSC